MTIDWRYTVEEKLGVLSVAGYLGPEAVRRFTGAVGWALARGTGPVIVDLTGLRGWSAEGQLALAEAARRLAGAGRRLELAAVPADGSLALAAHGAGRAGPSEGRQEWRTTGWPAEAADGRAGA